MFYICSCTVRLGLNKVLLSFYLCMVSVSYIQSNLLYVFTSFYLSRKFFIVYCLSLYELILSRLENNSKDNLSFFSLAMLFHKLYRTLHLLFVNPLTTCSFLFKFASSINIYFSLNFYVALPLLFIYLRYQL